MVTEDENISESCTALEHASNLYLAHRNEEALQILEEDCIQESRTEVLLLKAKVLSELERDAEAHACIEEAKRLDPTDPEVRFEYACFLWEISEIRPALAELESLLPDPSAVGNDAYAAMDLDMILWSILSILDDNNLKSEAKQKAGELLEIYGHIPCELFHWLAHKILVES